MGDKKYAGERSSRKSLLTWSEDDDHADGDEDHINDDVSLNLEGGDDIVDGHENGLDNDDEDDAVEDVNDEEAGTDKDDMTYTEVDETNGDKEQLESDDDDDDAADGNGDVDDSDASDLDGDDNAMNIDFSKLPADLQSAISETKGDSDDTL